MTNDEARNKVSILVQLFVIPVSSLIRHSTFVLRHLENSLARCDR
jgi:hypothetical protein